MLSKRSNTKNQGMLGLAAKNTSAPSSEVPYKVFFLLYGKIWKKYVCYFHLPFISH